VERRNEPRSFIMLISSMLIYGSIGVFRRYIPISSSALALFRGIIGCTLLLGIKLVSKKSLLPKADKKALILLFISGGLIGFNWIFLFESYRYTTVAAATLCYYLEPSIVMLLSPVFFKEKLTVKKLLCVIAAFSGMVLVSGIIQTGIPSAAQIRGIAFGIAAAVLYSAVVILNKKLPDTEPLSKTLVQLLSASVVILPYVLLSQGFSDVPTDARSVVLILVVGIVHTGLAYALYFGSMNGLSTQTVAIFSYVDPVTALLLSIFLLHEEFSMLGIIGAVLMIGSAIVSVTGRQKQ